MRQTSLIVFKRPPSGDVWAVSLSAVCLLHCLVVPVAAGSLALAGSLGGSAWLHWALVVAALPLSAWTLTQPHRRGRSRPALALGLVGLALLVCGAAGFPQRDFETPITVVGAGVLIIAHALNWRHRRRG
ncbi:MerC domain-containing protein [Brevundimonas aurantiaca]|uniref:MerC domain-containing protein n=1 Tax=Brevundimonas aurantiaca TaxID=74316 RepID=UPI004033D1BE